MRTFKLWLCAALLYMAGQSHAQSVSKDFYYYQGQKLSLKRNMGAIMVAVPEQGLRSFETTMRNGATAERISEDYSMNSLIALPNTEKRGKVVYYEIATAQGRYSNEFNNWSASANVISVAPVFELNGQKIWATNNAYVKLKSASDLALLRDLSKKWGFDILGSNKFMPLWFNVACTKKGNTNAIDLANRLYETGAFETAEPEFFAEDTTDYSGEELSRNSNAAQTGQPTQSLLSSDTYFNDQWGLKNTGQYGAAYAGIDVKAEFAWNITTGAGIKLAILDTGVEVTHPDLAANISGLGYDTQNGTSPNVVRNLSGTAAAGLVGAVQNSIGVSGVAPNVGIMPISWPAGGPSATPQMRADGLNWAVNNGADVLLMRGFGATASTLIDNAVTNALNNGRGGKGALIVAGSGASNNTSVPYPGTPDPRIMFVGDISPCGQRRAPGTCEPNQDYVQPTNTVGSNYGTFLDVMGPGSKMPSTDITSVSSGYNPGGGQSVFFTPDYADANYSITGGGFGQGNCIVAGVAALVLSVNPNLTVTQLTNIIEQTSQKIRPTLYTYSTTSGRPNGTWNNQMGYGLVNAYAAVTEAQEIGCPANITINTTQGTSQTYQASNTITSTSNILSDVFVNYRATTILLKPGFRVSGVNYGVFRAYPDPCTVGRPAIATGTEQVAYESGEDSSQRMVQNPNVTVSPNPNHGVFTIALANRAEGHVEVTDLLGFKVSAVDFTNQSEVMIDLQDNPKGIYLVKVTTGGTFFSTKVIKN